jgi:hypothetical protein
MKEGRGKWALRGLLLFMLVVGVVLAILGEECSRLGRVLGPALARLGDQPDREHERLAPYRAQRQALER